MKPVRVALADDHAIVRQGLCSLLEGDASFEVVGEAANGEQMLRLVAKERPDVAIVDLQMPDLGGAELCQRITATNPATAILILTAFFDWSLVDACLRAGARGFLLKDAEDLRLRESLLAVAQGHAALDPRVAGVVTEYLVKQSASPGVLTARELEVLRLMAGGLSNKNIGAKLCISENTVKDHVKVILGKVRARNRLEAVLRARERGLL